MASVPSRLRRERSLAVLRMTPAGSSLAHARQAASLRSRLSTFLLQALTDVAYALVLVRVRRTERSHFGSNLAHFLTVDTGQRDSCLLRVNGRIDTGRQRVLDGVRESEVEYDQGLAFH